MNETVGLDDSSAVIYMEKRVLNIPLIGGDPYEHFFEDHNDIYDSVNDIMESPVDSYSRVSMIGSDGVVKNVDSKENYRELRERNFSAFHASTTELWEDGQANFNLETGSYFSSNVYSLAVKGDLNNLEFSRIVSEMIENGYRHR